MWRDVTSRDGYRSGSGGGSGIVGLRDGDEVLRVSPDSINDNKFHPSLAVEYLIMSSI